MNTAPNDYRRAPGEPPGEPATSPAHSPHRRAALLASLLLVLLAVFAAQSQASGFMRQAASAPEGLTSGQLTGVSCPSATSCMAVGDGASGDGAEPAVFAESSGASAWTLTPPFSEAESAASGVSAVSCTSPSFCVAVGSAGDPPQIGPLIEAWNGASWTRQPSPGAGELSGVSCVSQSYCVAVGSATTGALSEVWNGSSWVRSVIAIRHHNLELSSVSCTAPAACTAAGFYDVRTSRITANEFGLIERWNGSRWSPQAVPDFKVKGSHWDVALAGVSCAAQSSCIAVGQADPPGNGFPLEIAERWSGGAWRIARAGFPPPPVLTAFNHGELGMLGSVSCSSPTSCIATGSLSTLGHGAGPYHAIAAIWNGSRWSNDALPAGSGPVEPRSVSCLTSGACTLVGGGAGHLTIETGS
jgi:hypothetical protein